MADLPSQLAAPSRILPLEALVETWMTARIAVRITGCGVLVHDLPLLRRIRGALGQELLATASPQAVAGQPCPWRPPCALDVLFREQGRAGNMGIPKPFVLATDRRDRKSVV